MRYIIMNYLQANKILKLILIIIIITLAITLNLIPVDASEESSIDISEYFKDKGAIDPNDSSMESSTFDFTYVPSIYMQDYDDVIMPNGKSISESGNLICCISMLASYKNKEWILPDTITSDSSVFNENGELNKDKALKKYCGNYNQMNFDFEDLKNALNQDCTVLLRIPQRSKFGEVSTYLIVTALSRDGKIEIRDPNKFNIQKYGTPVEYFHSYTYDMGDIIISTGSSGYMYIFK